MPGMPHMGEGYCTAPESLSINMSDIKGTVSRDFLSLFFAEKILPGLHMNRQKCFREILRFREDIRSQSSCSQRLQRHTNFSFHIFKFLLLELLIVTFSPDCSFKI